VFALRFRYADMAASAVVNSYARSRKLSAGLAAKSAYLSNRSRYFSAQS
jgi:hypothetical protein